MVVASARISVLNLGNQKGRFLLMSRIGKNKQTHKQKILSRFSLAIFLVQSVNASAYHEHFTALLKLFKEFGNLAFYYFLKNWCGC